jgi:membrane protein
MDVDEAGRKWTRMVPMWKLGGLGWRQLARRVWRESMEDRIWNLAAMLAFYFVFSIFPFLLFVVTLLGLLLQPGSALHEVFRKYLTAIAPASASDIIDTTLQQISRNAGSAKLSAGIVFTLWAASQGMLGLMDALNITYEVRESRPWWKSYLTALLLTFGALGLMALALVMIGYGDGVALFLARYLGFSGFLVGFANVLEWLLQLLFVLAAFNVAYIVAPNVRHREWHWLMPGTVIGVSLWLLVSYGFKVYLGFFNLYSATYGSIGTVIILLSWFYLTGLSILVGGEVNSEIEKATRGIVRPTSRQHRDH